MYHVKLTWLLKMHISVVFIRRVKHLLFSAFDRSRKRSKKKNIGYLNDMGRVKSIIWKIRLFPTWISWLLSVWGSWYQFCEHCCPHKVPSSANTHSAEECLTIYLICCLVCFVWGASEEGLVLRQKGFFWIHIHTHTSYPVSFFSFLTLSYVLQKLTISPALHITLISYRYLDLAL